LRRWGLAGAAGLSAWLLLGGTTGLLGGAALVVGGERLLRRAAPDAGAEARMARVRELPGACDLLAVLLSAGVPVGGALAAVGQAVPVPLGTDLQNVAALYRLGAEPRRAWADATPELGQLGRALVRAGESGSSVAPALRALAADARASARAATETAVRRAGVWVLAPLGVCFLPAFLCLGVVPLVLGIAGEVFG
jgi:pilus assembly protein TadC